MRKIYKSDPKRVSLLFAWKSVQDGGVCLLNNPSLFCAAVGTGNQLIVLTILALMGITSSRMSILAGVVVLYCLTSGIAGFTAVRLFRQMHGKKWVKCSLLTTVLFPAPVVAIFTLTNWVAAAHGSARALPFDSIVRCLELYLFISFPLTILGGFLAKNYTSAEFNAPTRTMKVAREIPTERRGRAFQMLIAGFIPFSAVHIEVFYFLASLWSFKTYTWFGYTLLSSMSLSFMLLFIVSSLLTVALLPYGGNDQWWWETYINGGMTGLFIYMYSFYFYFYKSGMTGLLQGSFYFGYMAIISLALFLMLGSAGFQFSLEFVRYARSQQGRAH
jgi:transmembrane 9 superfamily protein 1